MPLLEQLIAGNPMFRQALTRKQLDAISALTSQLEVIHMEISNADKNQHYSKTPSDEPQTHSHAKLLALYLSSDELFFGKLLGRKSSPEEIVNKLMIKVNDFSKQNNLETPIPVKAIEAALDQCIAWHEVHNQITIIRDCIRKDAIAEIDINRMTEVNDDLQPIPSFLVACLQDRIASIIYQYSTNHSPKPKEALALVRLIGDAMSHDLLGKDHKIALVTFFFEHAIAYKAQLSKYDNKLKMNRAGKLIELLKPSLVQLVLSVRKGKKPIKEVARSFEKHLMCLDFALSEDCKQDKENLVTKILQPLVDIIENAYLNKDSDQFREGQGTSKKCSTSGDHAPSRPEDEDYDQLNSEGEETSEEDFTSGGSAPSSPVTDRPADKDIEAASGEPAETHHTSAKPNLSAGLFKPDHKLLDESMQDFADFFIDQHPQSDIAQYNGSKIKVKQC